MSPPSQIFTSVRVGHHTLSNRVVMAPMTRSRAKQNGTPGDLAAEYYAQRAGVGPIVGEGTQPSNDGQGYLTTPGVYTSVLRRVVPSRPAPTASRPTVRTVISSSNSSPRAPTRAPTAMAAPSRSRFAIEVATAIAGEIGAHRTATDLESYA
jgi:hypothetical protein